MALRRPGEDQYTLGILIDNAPYYDQSDLLERDVMRPRLLENFGWRIYFVLAKDWYADRESVVRDIVGLVDAKVSM